MINQSIAIKASREGFPEYCVTIDPDYSLEWFHNIIALKLEDSVRRVENGEDVRIMILMPPRHGKSDEATQKFPSWVLGEHPEWPFIVSSYSQELATDFGQGTRDIMDSSNYKAIFETRLRQDTQAKSKWMTEEGGGYTAVGVGGAITGRGFKIGIIDDPFKNREEADSPVTRESVHKWWKSTFYTRQEGNSAIIVILTRWHDDDLAGRLLREEEEAIKNGETDYDKWEVLEFKAIAEKDDAYRKTGEALWPQKFNVSKLQKTKATLGSYEFSALYQQNPIDEESQEFKKEWLQYRSFDEVSKMVTRKFATIDPAGSKKKKSDYTGCTRNYVNANNDWHLKSSRYRINSKGIIDLIFELHEAGFEQIGIEEGTYLDSIEPFLKVEMDQKKIYPNIIPLKHGGTMKETRIRGLIPRYENKKVYHIDKTCLHLEEEYLRFPKASHDDCLDTVAYQSQIAIPPVLGFGDTITSDEVFSNVSSVVNDQTGPVLIGISTSFPVHYVIGNRQGLFYNRITNVTEKDPFEELDTIIKKFDKCFIVSDQIGDVIGLKMLQAKYPGKIFICFIKNDSNSQNIVKWGKDKEFGTVEVNKNSIIQLIVDEMKDKRFVLNGSKEDWKDYAREFSTLFRLWELNSLGDKVSTWETSGPQNFIKSTIMFRVALDKFATSMATVVEPGMFGDMQVGRIFDNSVNMSDTWNL